MDYGICNLSVVPLRLDPSDSSEMVSQVLLGEHFKVLEIRNKWSKIRLAYDNYEGWLDNKQFLLISLEDYDKVDKSTTYLSGDIINFGENQQQLLTNIVIGSHLPFYKEGQFLIGEEKFLFEGDVVSGKLNKENIVSTALQFLNTPYLWGGKPLLELTVLVLLNWYTN